MVLYRKFRPSNFASVKGQEAITDVLRSAIIHKQVSHAYLFTGTRGTGKTSTARIFSKAINCISPIDGEPCDKCESCKSFNEGRNIDLVEIDAASNRGIDDIREIKERVNFSPSMSKYKVYIIDEVHMLTKDAFNALLKTLEEPPSTVVFILATTEVYKVPMTVISRCQRFDFKNASETNLIKLLTDISKKEKIDLDEKSIELVSDLAEGSYRDALSILEKLHSHEGKIVYEKALEILGIPDQKLLENVFLALLKCDTKLALEELSNALSKGMEVYQFTKSILHLLEKELLKTVSTKESKIPMEVLLRYIKGFVSVDEKLKSSAFPKVILEAALVELASGTSVQVQSKEISSNHTKQPIFSEFKEKPTSPKVVVKNETVRETIKDKAIKDTSNDESFDNVPVNIDANVSDVLKVWGKLISQITPFNHHLGSFLSHAKPVRIEERFLILEVKYSFHKDRIEDIKSREAFAEHIQKLVGYKLLPKCIVNSSMEIISKQPIEPAQIEKKDKMPDNVKKPVQNEPEEDDILAEAMKIFELG